MLSAISLALTFFVLIGFAPLPAAAQGSNEKLPIEAVPNIPNGVYSLAFSPDGVRAVSGGDDGTVKLWDVTTGRLLRTLWGHANHVLAVAFSSDGGRVLSGSKDKTLRY